MRKVMALAATVLLLAASMLLQGCGGGEKSQNSQPNQPKKAEFPTKPITWVFTSQPGGSVDQAGRPVAEVAGKIAGQPVVVEYKAGSGGAQAALDVKNAKPDGYTLLFMMVGQTIAPHVNPSVGYTVDDFIPIAQITANPLAFATKADSPIRSMDDLFKEAKKRDGKLTIGAYGTGSLQRVITGMLTKKYGLNVKYVPYDTDAEVVAAVLGGNIDVSINSASTMTSHHKAGKVNLIGVTHDQRYELLPDVPSLKEQGYDIVIHGWYGVGAPKGTPKEVVDILAGIFEKAINDPTVKEAHLKSKARSAYLPPDQFAEKVKRENAEHKAIVEEFIKAK